MSHFNYCSRCDGRQRVTMNSVPCTRCNGTGYEPEATPENDKGAGEEVSWAYRRQEINKSMATVYRALTGREPGVPEDRR